MGRILKRPRVLKGPRARRLPARVGSAEFAGAAEPAVRAALVPVAPPTAPAAAPAPPAPAIVEVVAADLAWPHRLARAAIWALPVYAVAHLWQGVRPLPDPLADPVAWAERVTSDGYLASQVLAGLGSALLGLVAVIALTVLLAATASRLLAVVGLLAALAAATLALPRQGIAVFAAPALGEQVQAGNLAAAAAYHQAYAPGEPLLSAGTVPLIGSVFLGGPDPLVGSAFLGGTVLATVSWAVLGLAVWRCRRFNRTDGLLLGCAAPLLGVASGYLNILLPLGALLLLAGAIGIAWSARRWPAPEPA